MGNEYLVKWWDGFGWEHPHFNERGNKRTFSRLAALKAAEQLLTQGATRSEVWTADGKERIARFGRAVS